MKINIGNHEFTELWDGVLYKALSEYPNVSDNEMKDIIDFVNYEKINGRKAFYIVHLPVVVLCQYFISLTGIGCIYNFVLSFVISVIITCGICFTFCGKKFLK